MRSLFLQTCVVASCGALGAVLNLAVGAAASEACRIVFVGDSLTAGYGLEESQSWPARMADRLAAEGYDCAVTNAGLSGDTTAGGRARLGWVLADAPTHVVLALGANDGLRAVPTDEMRANLEAMLAELDAAGVEVLLAGMLAPPNLGEAYGERYRTAFGELAQAHAVAFYPFLLEGVAARPELNQADGIHPNEAGVDVLVENFWPTFERWLEGTGVAPA